MIQVTDRDPNIITLCKCPRCQIVGPLAGCSEVRLGIQTFGEKTNGKRTFSTYHYEFDEWFREKEQRTKLCPNCTAELVNALRVWAGISPAEVEDPASGPLPATGGPASHWWPWAKRVLLAFPRHLRKALKAGVGP